MNIAFFCIPAHGHTNPTLAVVQDRHTLTGSVGLRSKEEIKAMLDGCK